MTLVVNPFAKKSPTHRAALKRVKALVRSHFRLTDAETILVTELACQLAGCPPLETIIAFWGEDERRRHYKVFKPVEQVFEEDLPPWWMKDALVQDEIAGCSCC
jgi:hypothetical protein